MAGATLVGAGSRTLIVLFQDSSDFRPWMFMIADDRVEPAVVRAKNKKRRANEWSMVRKSAFLVQKPCRLYPDIYGLSRVYDKSEGMISLQAKSEYGTA